MAVKHDNFQEKSCDTFLTGISTQKIACVGSERVSRNYFEKI